MNELNHLQQFLHKMDSLAILGFVAQAAFTARFLVQWIASERAKRSVIPVAFWHLSIVGSLGLLVYAYARRDPVFFVGYMFNTVPYVRNLMLLKKEKNSLPAQS